MRQLFFIIFNILYAGIVLADGNSDSVTLSITQSPIAEIDIAYTTINLDIAGLDPGTPGEDSETTTYDISIMPAATQKITGVLDSNPPSGITLKANFSAPTGSGGSSEGIVNLSTSTADLVRDMTNNCTVSNVSVTFIMANDGTAGPFGPQPHLFTATIENQ